MGVDGGGDESSSLRADPLMTKVTSCRSLVSETTLA